jgi:hypothetical protein
MLMALPPVIESVRRRPSMFLHSETFDSVVAFLNGYDAAQSFCFIGGLRERIIVRANRDSNLAWPGIVLMILEDSNSPESVERLFVLLEQFIDIRDSRDGLRRIFLEYECWLHDQAWYNPDSPDWLSVKNAAYGTSPPKKLRSVRSRRRSTSKRT